jgi:hypothetical protein
VNGKKPNIGMDQEEMTSITVPKRVSDMLGMIADGRGKADTAERLFTWMLSIPADIRESIVSRQSARAQIEILRLLLEQLERHAAALVNPDPLKSSASTFRPTVMRVDTHDQYPRQSPREPSASTPPAAKPSAQSE